MGQGNSKKKQKKKIEPQDTTVYPEEKTENPPSSRDVAPIFNTEVDSDVEIDLTDSDSDRDQKGRAPSKIHRRPKSRFHSRVIPDNSSDESSDYDRHPIAVSEEAVSTILSVHSRASDEDFRKGHGRQKDARTQKISFIQASDDENDESRISIRLDSISEKDCKEDEEENKSFSQLQQENIEEELKDIFERLDINEDGSLQVREFQRALFRVPALGAYVRPQDVRLAFIILGIPQDQAMTFAQFRRFCIETKDKHTTALESRETLEWVEHLRSMFFRFGADRSGSLSLKQLRRGLLLSPSLGLLLRAKEIDALLGKLEMPKKEKIDFHLFKMFCLDLAASNISTKQGLKAMRSLKLIRQLKSIFESLDVDQSGTLEIPELKRAIKRRPDISRVVRPLELRRTFIDMSIPSNGHVNYDTFEHCVLAASGGIKYQKQHDDVTEVLLDLPSSNDGNSIGIGSSSDENHVLSEEDRSLGSSEEDSLHWGSTLNDGVSINFSEIAKSRASKRRFRHKQPKQANDGYVDPCMAHMDGYSSNEERGNEDDHFSYNGSATGRSRWSMQSHKDADELYEHNHPDLVLIGGSSEDGGTDDSSVEGFGKEGDMHQGMDGHDDWDRGVFRLEVGGNPRYKTEERKNNGGVEGRPEEDEVQLVHSDDEPTSTPRLEFVEKERMRDANILQDTTPVDIDLDALSSSEENEEIDMDEHLLPMKSQAVVRKAVLPEENFHSRNIRKQL